MEPGDRLAPHGRRLKLLLAHLAGRALRARVELDDLLQEVYLRALLAPDALPDPAQGDEAVFRHLALLARRVVVDAARALRAVKRDARVVPLDRSTWSRAGPRESQLFARDAGVLTHLVGMETEERMLAAFDELTPEHRRVLGLRQFEGLPAGETASRMGRSESAVHSLYRRALAAWEVASR